MCQYALTSPDTGGRITLVELFQMMADVTWITGRSFWWERNKKELKKRSKQVKFVVVVVVGVGVVINDDDDIGLTHKHPQICASRNRPDVTKTEIDLQTFFKFRLLCVSFKKCHSMS